MALSVWPLNPFSLTGGRLTSCGAGSVHHVVELGDEGLAGEVGLFLPDRLPVSAFLSCAFSRLLIVLEDWLGSPV